MQRSVHDPNMILASAATPATAPHQSLVRKCFRPKGVHLKRGHHLYWLRVSTIRKATGPLKIGDKKEIDKASWRKGDSRLPPTSRYRPSSFRPSGRSAV